MTLYILYLHVPIYLSTTTTIIPSVQVCVSRVSIVPIVCLSDVVHTLYYDILVRTLVSFERKESFQFLFFFFFLVCFWCFV